MHKQRKRHVLITLTSASLLVCAGCSPMHVKSPKNAVVVTPAKTSQLNTSYATQITTQPDERSVQGKTINLQTSDLKLKIVPATMSFKMGAPGQALKTISQAQPAVEVRNLKAGHKSASWQMPSKGLTVLVQIVQKSIRVKIEATKQTSITWPVIGKNTKSKAMLLPLAEGRYVPTNDKECIQFLTQQESGSLNDTFSMPFWGIEDKHNTLTYRVDNPFNDNVNFANDNGQLGLGLTHDFNAMSLHQAYGVAIYLGADNLDEPAKIYRQTLQDHHQFVTLSDKIQKNPAVQKLLGAAFVYLWGSDQFAPADVKNWVAFAQKILQQSNADAPSPGKRIFQLLSKTDQTTIAAIASAGYADTYQKTTLTRSFGALLDGSNFYDQKSWQGVQLEQKTQNLLHKPTSSLNETERYQLNDLLLYDAFPGLFTPVNTWGDGVSTKMLSQFQSAGLSNLWLGLSDWEMGYKHPQFVKQAESMGYLVATYDSYTTLQDPEHPFDPTFDTSLFDESLYQNGAIVQADGSKVPGFQGEGYAAEPTVMMPYVKQRFQSIMNNVPFNSWFVDSDGDATLYDDYAKQHPATQKDEMNAIIQRLQWFGKQNEVVGTEEGNWFSVPSVDFAQGMLTPAFNWMDKDMKDKSSPYDWGSYWPPEDPTIFTKPVPIKPIYQHVFVDPKFNLPLYGMVYHDSIIVTDHWLTGSLKLKGDDQTRSLTEMLYDAPPLYHLNLDEWNQDKNAIERYYRVWSPVEKKAALLNMSSFDFLTTNRLVQRADYGNQLEVVANYSTEPYTYDDHKIPAGSVFIHWLDSGKTEMYTP
ncbi:glycoside hydrolase [Alicyclobacillus fodiniaquatilis]|uniref:Glycoside hydrolase n=1 Tax=Alicyclobacillus fodiniaquatilis TaxID=1661150 RepID=A0ABW4JST0_9BACL